MRTKTRTATSTLTYVHGYAYPTSPIADKLSAPNGCYYVGAYRPNHKLAHVYGPYATEELARCSAARGREEGVMSAETERAEHRPPYTPRITHTFTPASSWIEGLTYIRPADRYSSDSRLSSAYLVVWTRDSRTGAPRDALLYLIPAEHLARACKLPGLLKAGSAGEVKRLGRSVGRAYWRLLRGKFQEQTCDRETVRKMLRSLK